MKNSPLKHMHNFYIQELYYLNFIFDYFKRKHLFIIFYELIFAVALMLINLFVTNFLLDVNIILMSITILLGATITSISIIVTNKKQIIDSYYCIYSKTEGFKEKKDDKQINGALSEMFDNSMSNFYFLTMLETVTLIISIIANQFNSVLLHSLVLFFLVYTLKIFLNCLSIFFLFSKK